MSSSQLERLRDFSACDVSDALLKLQKLEAGGIAHGGYLADLVPFAPVSPFSGSLESQPKVIAPVSTLQVVSKTTPQGELPSQDDPAAIPKGTHWVDLVEKGTVLVIDQPLEQNCAALGGIMLARMKTIGAAGVVVSGRVRDLSELKETALPVWARGRSTVGTGAEAKVKARNVPIKIGAVAINPGDIIFCDPLEGVVVIPEALIDAVLELMPKLVAADDKVKEDVLAGARVFDAFQKHRG